MSLHDYGNRRVKTAYDRLPAALQDAAATAYGLRHRSQAHGDYYRSYARLLSVTEKMSHEELSLRQLERVRTMLRHAGEFSPFWRARFETAGWDADDFDSLSQLRKLPLLEKEDVHAAGSGIQSRDFLGKKKAVVAAHTSGTSGKALHLYLSRECYEREYAFLDQHRLWGGIRPSDRRATFAGHPVVPTNLMRPPYWRYNRAERQLLFSSQHLGPATALEYAGALRDFAPLLIHGYPSSLFVMASLLLQRDDRSIRPRAVYTHSETLLETQRAAIEAAFGCRVYNWYGNTEEVGNIVECPAGRMHVRLEHSFLEFLRPDGTEAGPGDVAEIVGTGFGNLATPLIRYRLGDSVVLAADDDCSCGRSGPMVESVVGRVEDIFVTPDGRYVGRLDHVFKDSVNVIEAQLVQETLGDVRVRVVPRPSFSESDWTEIERLLRLRLGDRVRLHREELDQIPRAANGKFRFAVSAVPAFVRPGAPGSDRSA